MDPVIALLVCSSAFAGPPSACVGEHAAAIRPAVARATDVERALPNSDVERVADTPDLTADIARWQPFIVEAARRFGIPQAWIRAVMRAESRGQATVEGRPIVSPAGAIGLMQVMPETYAEMQRRHGLGLDPAEPRDNILAGTAYLREMLDRFGYPHLFAAYNAGPERFEAHRRGQRPLPGETQAYLARIKVDLSNASDGTVQSADSPSQPAPSESRRAADPRLFFPLGRHSPLFVERHDSVSVVKPSGPDRALDPARNRARFAPRRGTPLSPRGEQGPP